MSGGGQLGPLHLPRLHLTASPQGPWDPTWEALSEGLKSPPKLKTQSLQGLPLPDLQQPVTKSAPPTALTRPLPIPSSPVASAQPS